MSKAVPHDKSSLASFLYSLGTGNEMEVGPQKYIIDVHSVPLIILRTRNPERTSNKEMGWMVVGLEFA